VQLLFPSLSIEYIWRDLSTAAQTQLVQHVYIAERLISHRMSTYVDGTNDAKSDQHRLRNSGSQFHSVFNFILFVQQMIRQSTK